MKSFIREEIIHYIFELKLHGDIIHKLPKSFDEKYFRPKMSHSANYLFEHVSKLVHFIPLFVECNNDYICLKIINLSYIL